MRTLRLVWRLCAIALCLFFSSCEEGTAGMRSEIDSLNAVAAQVKYKSLDVADGLVDTILSRSRRINYREGVHEALLLKGDLHAMRMDFDLARVCYSQVLAESANDLICGSADVDMMSVCVMTSKNKEFYDYRNDALERMANVEEDHLVMTPRQRALWNAMQIDFHLVSASYHLKMWQDEAVKDELVWLRSNQSLVEEDSSRLAACLFLETQLSGVDDEDSAIGGTGGDERNYNPVRLLALSRQGGFTYYESLACNALARGMIERRRMRPSTRLFLAETLGVPDTGLLDFMLAGWAVELARRYGNDFVYTSALVTMSDYWLSVDNHNLALVPMMDALRLLNDNHRRMRARLLDGECCDSLSLFADQGDELSTEMRWIADTDVPSVPEWMAMVREQLSVVYGAMGRKAESDYNHNIYFDILDATRQDLRMEREEELLERDERLFNSLLWTLVVSLVALPLALFLYHRRSAKVYARKVRMLNEVLDICKRMAGAFPEEVSDEEALCAAMHSVSDADVERFFPTTRGEDWTCVSEKTFGGMDREMLRVLQVFYEWMRHNGALFVKFSEERQTIEGDTIAAGRRFEEDKRRYMEKLTSLSIVNGIVPFLDRALHEVAKLKDGTLRTEEDTRARLEYLGELVDKIHQYNEVLGHWVKIRQGEVLLNVETFALQAQFDTLRRSAKSFSLKGVELHVEDTPAVVRADKAMTLFMMNTLLDNARKYTPAGGSVTLRAVELADSVEVSVADTGPGLSARDVDTINNSKVYDSGKIGAEGTHSEEIKKNKGFGFGLMNCKGIIGKYRKTNALFHVCQFGVESEEGRGSRFFFRLPKGVLRAVMLCVFFGAYVGARAFSGGASRPDGGESVGVWVDSVFVSNVRGEYGQAVQYADSAIHSLNRQYLSQQPDGAQLMTLEQGGMAELSWWRGGVSVDYDLVIALRNEVAIAALSLGHRSLYRYNSEVFTRLNKLTTADPTLEDYCDKVRQANRNKKTAVILLGILLVVVTAVFLFLHYRASRLFVFNLRQLIQLNNKVFSASQEDLLPVLLRYVSDIKPASSIGLLTPSDDGLHPCHCQYAGEVCRPEFAARKEALGHLMRLAMAQNTEVKDLAECVRAFPLHVRGSEDGTLGGVLGLCFHDGTMTSEEALIIRLVTQFVSINTYFSRIRVAEMAEAIEAGKDTRLRVESERQRVYVRNLVMDNCLSTLKHETLYFPSRIRQLVNAALREPDTAARAGRVQDIDELLTYYKEIFTILSSCAARQVEMRLFRRETGPPQIVADLTARAFKRKTAHMTTPPDGHIGSLLTAPPDGHNAQRVGWPDGHNGSRMGSRRMDISPSAWAGWVQYDKVFLAMLVDNIVELFLQHRSGGDLVLDFEESERFVNFAFTDTAHRYADDELARMFHADNLRYDPASDTLAGAPYLLCRQIVREHDEHSTHRGCRIFAENLPGGSGSRFVFALSRT